MITIDPALPVPRSSKGPRPSFRDAGMPFADPPLMFLAPSVKTQHVLGRECLRCVVCA